MTETKTLINTRTASCLPRGVDYDRAGWLETRGIGRFLLEDLGLTLRTGVVDAFWMDRVIDWEDIGIWDAEKKVLW